MDLCISGKSKIVLTQLTMQNAPVGYELLITDWHNNTGYSLYFATVKDARAYAESIVSWNIDATVYDENDEEVDFIGSEYVESK